MAKHLASRTGGIVGPTGRLLDKEKLFDKHVNPAPGCSGPNKSRVRSDGVEMVYIHRRRVGCRRRGDFD
jgi:hypothetical protein